MTADPTAGLARGPATRQRHGEIRGLIRDGRVYLPRLLVGDGDDAIETEALRIGIGSLVRAVPRLGNDPGTLERVLDGIAESRRMGELSTRTRKRLAETITRELADHA